MDNTYFPEILDIPQHLIEEIRESCADTVSVRFQTEDDTIYGDGVYFLSFEERDSYYRNGGIWSYVNCKTILEHIL